MKIQLSIFLFVASITICTSQNKKKNRIKEISTITTEYQIGFLTYDREFKLFHNPVIVENGKSYSIVDYNNDYGSYGEVVAISPNKKYIILDYIDMGYVGDKKDKKIHDVYFCVIIDLKKHKLIKQLRFECDGEWDKNNNWVSENKIIFEGK